MSTLHIARWDGTQAFCDGALTGKNPVRLVDPERGERHATCATCSERAAGEVARIRELIPQALGAPRLPIEALTFGPQGEGDGTALLATMQIGTAMFHVNAVRVTEEGDLQGPFTAAELAREGKESVSGECPSCGSLGPQNCCCHDEPCDAETLQELFNVYDGDSMETVELPGRPGHWLIVVHPYGE